MYRSVVAITARNAKFVNTVAFLSKHQILPPDPAWFESWRPKAGNRLCILRTALSTENQTSLLSTQVSENIWWTARFSSDATLNRAADRSSYHPRNPMLKHILFPTPCWNGSGVAGNSMLNSALLKCHASQVGGESACKHK